MFKNDPSIAPSEEQDLATKTKVKFKISKIIKQKGFTFLSAEEAKKGWKRKEEKDCKALNTRPEGLWYSRTSQKDLYWTREAGREN